MFLTGTHYDDGSIFRMFQNRLLRSSTDYPVKVEFVNQYASVIDGNNPNYFDVYESITYNVRTTNYEYKDTLYIYKIYGDGYNVKNIFMVFE